MLQLQATYSNPDLSLEPWPMSPCLVLDASRFDYFGNKAYQRAYMDYFSVQHTIKGGGATLIWALHHLWRVAKDGKALIYGLFGRSGRSLLFLSDGLEVPTAVMVVQGLTLAAIDWSQPIQDLLSACAFPHQQVQAQGQDNSVFPIFHRIGNDGRFSGLGLPDVHNFANIMNNARMRAALFDHVRQLYVHDFDRILSDLSRLSVLLACTTHKPGKPAFDLWLGRLPSLVVALRVLLETTAQMGAHRDFGYVLIRGVWMQMVLTYVSQMRPVINEGFLSGPTTTRTWEHMLAEFRADALLPSSKYADLYFPTLLRSIHRLAEFDNDPNSNDWYRKMASYVVGNWTRWGSTAGPQGLHLNIRAV